jgi:hypothetical protein
MTVTPQSGVFSCTKTAANCSSSDPFGATAANAIATATSGFVSVEVNGGATLHGTWATASATATDTQTFLFTNGAGSGILAYRVALIGFTTGTPAASSSVLLNGESYSVLPYAAPTYYSLTQTFTFGQSFELPLSITMEASWDGSRGEAGTRFASARLVDYSVSTNAPDTASTAAASDVPEPSTAILWIGGALLILLGLRRKPKQR